MNVEKYRLRPMTHADLELVWGWRNSERIRFYMYHDAIIPWEDHCRWFARIQEQETTIVLLFEYDGKPVGVINFTDLDRKNEKCHWGFYMGEEGLPKGTGTLMGKLGLQYAFEKIKVHKLIGEAFSFNEASIGFHQKLGFYKEGVLNRHIRKADKYEDIVVFAYFKEDYLKLRWEN